MYNVGAVVRDVRRGTRLLSVAQFVSSGKNGMKEAIVSGRDSDSGDLSFP